MIWLLLTVSCIILWGITDILYKRSSEYTDKLSHFKTFVWIGAVMLPAGIIMALFSNTLSASIEMLSDNLYLIPLCFFYAIALFFGLLGKRHLDASVVSPLENIDGAMAAVILYLYFLFAGYSDITDRIGLMDIIATLMISAGVILLGIQEQRLSKQELGLAEDKKRHRLGALVLIFPIIYNLADAVSMVVTSITVSDTASLSIPEIDFFIFECAGFSFIAILLWLYMAIFKKHIYIPFKKEELTRCGAAVGETLGTMAFIFAAAINPVLTAPIVSSYCLITILLARLLLKERLTKKQYLSIFFLVAGIIMLGASEIFSL